MAAPPPLVCVSENVKTENHDGRAAHLSFLSFIYLDEDICKFIFSEFSIEGL